MADITAIGLEVGKEYRILYTNYRGERKTYFILIVEFQYGSTEYHDSPGLLIEAVDILRDVRRTFAAKDIHKMEKVLPTMLKEKS